MKTYEFYASHGSTTSESYISLIQILSSDTKNKYQDLSDINKDEIENASTTQKGDVIRNLISQSRCLIVFAGDETNNSSYVNTEIALAKTLHKPIYAYVWDIENDALPFSDKEGIKVCRDSKTLLDSIKAMTDSEMLKVFIDVNSDKGNKH